MLRTRIIHFLPKLLLILGINAVLLGVGYYSLNVTLKDRVALAQTPDIISTKKDILFVDNDNDSRADPGDTILYSVIITNTSAFNANLVVFTDAIDFNTTLNGTFQTTPIARNDSYSVLGNVPLTVPAASGLIDGVLTSNSDNDPDGGLVTVNPVTNANTTFGGSITIASDGSFSYDPPPGFEGNDGYLYTITDDEGQTDLAFVFLNVDDAVWFVDNNPDSSSNLGTFNDPFTSVTALNNAQGVGFTDVNVGDTIFIYQGTGTYSDGIVLQDAQILLGQGVDLLTQLASRSIIPPAFSDLDLNSNPPSGDAFRPVLNDSTGAGIQIGANNLVRGLNVGNTSGMGIVDDGTSAGTVIIDTLAITGTGGGIEIDNGGTLAVNLDSLTANSNSEEGIDLAGVTGSFSVSNGSISTNGNQSAVDIAGTGLGVALNVNLGSVSSSGAANGIKIQNTTGSFTVTGEGSTAGSGGAIGSMSSSGIFLKDSQSISLNFMSIDGNTSDGIFAENVQDLDVKNNTFTNNDTGIYLAASPGGTMTFDVDNNSFTGQTKEAIRVVTGETATGAYHGKITNNTIGDGTADSGSQDRFGIHVEQRGTPDMLVEIADNNVKNTDLEGIFVEVGGTTGSSGAMDLTLTGNTVFPPDDNGTPPFQTISGILVQSQQDTSLCAYIANNESQPAVGIGNGYFLVQLNPSSFSLQGFINNAATTISNNNNKTGGGAPSIGTVGGFAGGCTATQPTVLQSQGDQLVNLSSNMALAQVAAGDLLDNDLAAFSNAAESARVALTSLTRNVTNALVSSLGPTPAHASGETIGIPLGTLNGGQVVRIIFFVTVDTPFPSNISEICNQALIEGSNFADVFTADPDTGIGGSPTCTLVDAAPDLRITKDDSGVTVTPGDTITYDLSYTNNGGQLASGVTITETVPANTTFNSSATTWDWSCLNGITAGNTCTVLIGNVAANGGGGQVDFAVDVDNPIAAGADNIVNIALIGDDGTHGGDQNPNDNSSSKTTPVDAVSDLQITKDDGGVTVSPGETIIYTLTFTDPGNQNAAGVMITETVPANTTFDEANTTANWTCEDILPGSACTLDVGTVTGGGGGSADFVVKVDDPLTPGVLQIDNTAEIGDDGSNGPDPNPNDNSHSISTSVTRVDLQITKDDLGVTVTPGDTINYQLTYANAGDQLASGVTITETVPANTTFNSGASSGDWSCADDSPGGTPCILLIGAVAGNGGGDQVDFAVDVDYPVAAGVGQIDNTAEIGDDGSSGADQNPNDNSDSDSTPVDVTPDLQITKDNGGVTVLPGDTIAYTLSFTDPGAQNATGVFITEVVPVNTTFDSEASTDGWSCEDVSAGSECVFEYGELAGAGGWDQVNFVVDVDRRLNAPTRIINSATIEDDGNNGVDPTPDDNSDSTTTNALPPSAVTDGSFCIFDRDPDLEGQQFRLVFTPDLKDMPNYKLPASNPGQQFYNVFYTGSGPTTFDISVPYPYVTQGAVPVHVYSAVLLTTIDGLDCFVPDPSSLIYTSDQQIVLGDYNVGRFGSTASIKLDNVPVPGKFVYVLIHLDYGLKGTHGYLPDSSDNAWDVNATEILLPNLANHTFMVSGSQNDSQTVQNINAFKRIPGIAGLVTNNSSSNPMVGVQVEIYDPQGGLLGTVYTDQDGWYQFVYKHRGRPAFYSVILPDHSKSLQVKLKGNGFAEANITVD